jgi:prepilin-type N-terminal cleavage/methylation domain-containing protein
MSRDDRSDGMTLIEICVVLFIMGLILAFSVPMLKNYNKGHQLNGAAENIAGQLRLARQIAIMSGVQQKFHFYAGYSGYDYHIHSGGGGVKMGWLLPKGVTYEWGDDLVGIRYQPDGSAVDEQTNQPASLDVVLIDSSTGMRDTVTVEASGYVLLH